MEVPLWDSRMAIWYQSAQVPSPAPRLPEGGSTGPPEAVGVLPPLVEVDLLLWREVNGFPPWLGAVDLLPWLDVDELPPWFEVGPCPPPWGVGWAPPSHPAEAPVAGVLVRAGLGGRGRPLGWALGVLGIGWPWRWGTRWIRPCWATLQW